MKTKYFSINNSPNPLTNTFVSVILWIVNSLDNIELLETR